jgi:hypothetical protein
MLDTTPTKLFSDAPTFDIERYEAVIDARGYEYEPGDDTAFQVRDQYWMEALDSAFRIRELEKLIVSTTDKKKLEKLTKELEHERETFGAYLCETEIAFGTQCAEYLRDILRDEFGLIFSEAYKLIFQPRLF